MVVDGLDCVWDGAGLVVMDGVRLCWGVGC